MFDGTHAVQLRVQEDYHRKVALYEEERSTAQAQNLTFRKRRPRDTRELAFDIRFNNEIAPIRASTVMG